MEISEKADPLIQELFSETRDRGLTLPKLETISGVSAMALWNWAAAKTSPTFGLLKPLAEALGYEIILKKKIRGEAPIDRRENCPTCKRPHKGWARCTICKEEFASNRMNQQTCGRRECKDELNRRGTKNRRESHNYKTFHKICARCNHPFTTRFDRQTYCSKSCAAKTREESLRLTTSPT